MNDQRNRDVAESPCLNVRKVNSHVLYLLAHAHHWGCVKHRNSCHKETVLDSPTEGSKCAWLDRCNCGPSHFALVRWFYLSVCVDKTACTEAPKGCSKSRLKSKPTVLSHSTATIHCYCFHGTVL